MRNCTPALGVSSVVLDELAEISCPDPNPGQQEPALGSLSKQSGGAFTVKSRVRPSPLGGRLLDGATNGRSRASVELALS